MVNPWFLLGALAAVIGAYFAGEHRGTHAKDIEWQAKTYHELAESSQVARTQEQMWQGVVNGTVKNGQKRNAAIESRLAAVLDELRQRPERPEGVSENPRVECKGANGAELSGRHAGFLERLAARAEAQDGALADCYAILDALKSP